MPPSAWNVLDFEKPSTELDDQIAQIRRITVERGQGPLGGHRFA